MAMTVGELLNTLKLMPKECLVQAVIPEPPIARPGMPILAPAPIQRHLKTLERCHHHGQDEDYVHPEQPVEIFVGDGQQMNVQDLVRRLRKFPAESLARVALPSIGHHRMLDIDVVGFGRSGDPPPVELTTEPLNSLEQGGSAIVRLDDVDPNEKGDWTYTDGGVRHHIEDVELQTRPKE
jgi:hypothetical protein